MERSAPLPYWDTMSDMQIKKSSRINGCRNYAILRL
jgi:hypothetical protein